MISCASATVLALYLSCADPVLAEPLRFDGHSIRSLALSPEGDRVVALSTKNEILEVHLESAPLRDCSQM
jgi:hypothetical protein